MSKMKKAYILTLAVIILIFSVICTANAANNKVDIYLFRGEGCSHCAEEEPFLQKLIDEKYGNRLIVHDYEVWYNEENAAYAEQFAKAYGTEMNGVPMTFIGARFFTGFRIKERVCL